jgi:type II secretory pathway component PulF
MPQFSYRARDAQGGLVEGVLNVADRSIAIRQIEQQNCTPIRIEAMAAEPSSLTKRRQSKISKFRMANC